MKSHICTARSFFIINTKAPTRGHNDDMVLLKCSAGYRKRESCNEVQFVINHEPLCAVHLSDEKSNQKFSLVFVHVNDFRPRYINVTITSSIIMRTYYVICSNINVFSTSLNTDSNIQEI